MDSPQEPLISDQQRRGELQYDADDAEPAPDDYAGPELSKPDTKPGVFVLMLTFAAGISGLLFGCW